MESMNRLKEQNLKRKKPCEWYDISSKYLLNEINQLHRNLFTSIDLNHSKSYIHHYHHHPPSHPSIETILSSFILFFNEFGLESKRVCYQSSSSLGYNGLSLYIDSSRCNCKNTEILLLLGIHPNQDEWNQIYMRKHRVLFARIYFLSIIRDLTKYSCDEDNKSEEAILEFMNDCFNELYGETIDQNSHTETEFGKYKGISTQYSTQSNFIDENSIITCAVVQQALKIYTDSKLVFTLSSIQLSNLAQFISTVVTSSLSNAYFYLIFGINILFIDKMIYQKSSDVHYNRIIITFKTYSHDINILHSSLLSASVSISKTMMAMIIVTAMIRLLQFSEPNLILLPSSHLLLLNDAKEDDSKDCNKDNNSVNSLLNRILSTFWLRIQSSGYETTKEFKNYFTPILSEFIINGIKNVNGSLSQIYLSRGFHSIHPVACFFHGIRGSGKSSFSRIFVKVLQEILVEYFDPLLILKPIYIHLNKSIDDILQEFEENGIGAPNNDKSISNIISGQEATIQTHRSSVIILIFDEIPSYETYQIVVMKILVDKLDRRYDIKSKTSSFVSLFISNYSLDDESKLILSSSKLWKSLSIYEFKVIDGKSLFELIKNRLIHSTTRLSSSKLNGDSILPISISEESMDRLLFLLYVAKDQYDIRQIYRVVDTIAYWINEKLRENNIDYDNIESMIITIPVNNLLEKTNKDNNNDNNNNNSNSSFMNIHVDLLHSDHSVLTPTMIISLMKYSYSYSSFMVGNHSYNDKECDKNSDNRTLESYLFVPTVNSIPNRFTYDSSNGSSNGNNDNNANTIHFNQKNICETKFSENSPFIRDYNNLFEYFLYYYCNHVINPTVIVFQNQFLSEKFLSMIKQTFTDNITTKYLSFDLRIWKIKRSLVDHPSTKSIRDQLLHNMNDDERYDVTSTVSSHSTIISDESKVVAETESISKPLSKLMIVELKYEGNIKEMKNMEYYLRDLLDDIPSMTAYSTSKMKLIKDNMMFICLFKCNDDGHDNDGHDNDKNPWTLSQEILSRATLYIP